MTEGRATLFLALRLMLPALAGVVITAGLGGIDIGSGEGQRAILVASITTFGLSWIVAKRVHKRLASALIEQAKVEASRSDLETGLGNRRGLLALLGSDLRGINTLIVLRSESEPVEFADAMREATRPEQDHLFHIDDVVYAALLTNTSPSQAEIVLGRLNVPAAKARMSPGEDAEKWLERALADLEPAEPG